MNSELIRKLSLQAYEEACVELQVADAATWYIHRDPTPEQVNEKFAELIIQECCTRIQADWHKVHWRGPAHYDDFLTQALNAAYRTECVAEIKQHWGIPI